MTKDKTKEVLRDPKSWKEIERLGNAYRVVVFEAYGIVAERIQTMTRYIDWEHTHDYRDPVKIENWVDCGQFLLVDGHRERISDTDLLRQVWEASRG